MLIILIPYCNSAIFIDSQYKVDSAVSSGLKFCTPARLKFFCEKLIKGSGFFKKCGEVSDIISDVCVVRKG